MSKLRRLGVSKRLLRFIGDYLKKRDKRDIAFEIYALSVAP